MAKKKVAKKTGGKRTPKQAEVKVPEHAPALLEALAEAHPDADCALDWETPLQLLVATILSAQCTDARVNIVTPPLFERCRTARDYAEMETDDLIGLIRSTGFFNNKAKSIQGMAERLVAEHGGEVPQTMEEMLALPGVARKTANCVLGTAFGKNEGVIVDTHVKRLSNRMGLTEHSQPEKIERDLMAIVPREEWTVFGHRMTNHGRAWCTAKKPNCEECPVRPHCPQVGI